MKKTLVIDAGNSNIVMGYFLGDELMYHWRVHTDRKKLVDEYADMMESLLRKHELSMKIMDNIAISNVVPALQTTLERLAKKYFKNSPFFVGIDNKMNMKIKIDNPGELGADLIAAAPYAMDKYGLPLIIIDFGTATTLSAINSQREFLGGAISPGLAVSCEALYTYAPHLPHIRLESPPSVIGANTLHAMQSGILLGYKYLIEGLVTDMKKILGTDTKVIATGGLSGIFAEVSHIIDIRDPHLVLEGIKFLSDLHWKETNEKG